MRFLNAYLKPIHRISNQKDLMELLVDNDASMIVNKIHLLTDVN